MAANQRAYTTEYSYIGQPYVRPDYYAQERGQAGSVYGQPGSARSYASSQGALAPKPAPRPERKRWPNGRPYIPQTTQQSAAAAIPQAMPRVEAFVITHAMLAKAVILLLVCGAILIGTILMNAKATEIKYEINKVQNENVLLADEISMLNVKIEGARSIEQIEAYAKDELGMKYPKASQCIYVEEGQAASSDLASTIKQKAYGTGKAGASTAN